MVLYLATIEKVFLISLRNFLQYPVKSKMIYTHNQLNTNSNALKMVCKIK